MEYSNKRENQVKEEENVMESMIAEWYSGQQIFITGATGFMGKILVEKILRSCLKVHAVYILIRPKKSKEPNERVEEYLRNPIFDKIRDQANSSEIFKKLRCVNGDITQKNFGLSQEDQELLKNNISIVFHMAANVRFDLKLKQAVLYNSGGTRSMLDLACTFQNLKSFVHVSTTYCHCDETELEEKLYEAPHSPKHILELATWMDEDLLETLAPKLLGNSPNTYAYTKCLSEELVSQYSDRLPIAIARPSIVTPCYKEPIPGWVDNLNGPTGIIVGAGKGVIRSILCNMDLNADVVPVDLAINSLLIIAWKIGSQPRNAEVDVYNISCSKEHTFTWGLTLKLGRKYVFEYPFSVCLWYPGGTPKTSYVAHSIAVFFYHIIPAYFIDFLMILTRNKPFLVRVQKRIHNGLKVLQYYTTRPWLFHSNKLKKISEDLSEGDRKLFYTDWEPFNLEQYILNYILGARKYCVHEDLDTLPRARRLMKRLYYMNLIKNVILTCFMLWLFFYFASTFLNIFDPPFELLGTTYLQPHQTVSKNI